MTIKLPYSNFEWLSQEEIDNFDKNGHWNTDGDYGYFIKLVKSREETFETDLVMSSSDIRFGAKVNYNQTTYINKKKKSIF